jgi:HSP20 family molecular chaperone IbpA
MTTEQTVETTPAVQTDSQVAETREETRFVKPAVNITETETGLTITADMPGIQPDGLDVNFDKGVLILEGRPGPVHESKNYLIQEFAPKGYFRQFKLGENLDHEKIDASFDRGVVTVTIAKAEAAKPRKITIKTVN